MNPVKEMLSFNYHFCLDEDLGWAVPICRLGDYGSYGVLYRANVLDYPSPAALIQAGFKLDDFYREWWNAKVNRSYYQENDQTINGINHSGKLAKSTIQADIANVREEADRNSPLIHRLPINTRVFGRLVGKDWFEIHYVKRKRLDTIPLKGYMHKSVFSEMKNPKTEEDSIIYLERKFATYHHNVENNRKLYEMYKRRGETNKASAIEPYVNGTFPVTLAIMLSDGRMAVVGKVFPDGTCEKLVFYVHEGETVEDGKERDRLYLSGQCWYANGPGYMESEFYPEIFPHMGFGTLGAACGDDGSKIMWFELSKGRARQKSNFSIRTDILYTSEQFETVPVQTDARMLQKLPADSSLVNLLYHNHRQHSCEKSRRPDTLLQALNVTRLPRQTITDVGYLFDDVISERYGWGRVILDKDNGVIAAASGEPGHWFIPVGWKEKTLISVSHHSTEFRNCDAKGGGDSVIILMLMPDGRLIQHEIEVGNWGC